MTAVERKEEIIRLIGEKGKISVDTLAELLQVSNMTVRRDLSSLEKNGVLERTHGAAVMRRETEYSEKAEAGVEEKQKIAEICMKFINPGDTIYLDSGTTTFEIARKILDIPHLVVITNDIFIAFLLHQSSNIEVMFCGGMLQKSTGSTYGFFANQMVGYVQMDKAFIGAASINENFNVLTPTMEKASLKRMVVNNANASYLVVDSSKFNKKALMKINHLSAYTGVVTMKKFNTEEMEKIKKKKICIISEVLD